MTQAKAACLVVDANRLNGSASCVGWHGFSELLQGLSMCVTVQLNAVSPNEPEDIGCAGHPSRNAPCRDGGMPVICQQPFRRCGAVNQDWRQS